jgi:hypothetical protein
MIYVLPKIAVWLLVIGGAYWMLGPQSFDSSREENALQHQSPQLFLPPAKPDRLLSYERRYEAGRLEPSEFSEYQALVNAYQDSFWEGDGLSVEEALSEVKEKRGEGLASLLAERGLTREEQAIFMTVLMRDHPEILDDRD